MSKYGHIKSMNDLDNEILRLDIKKKVIQNEFKLNTQELKESILPVNLLTNFLGLNDESSRSRIFTVLRAIVIIFSTFRGGMKLVNSIKSLWK